MKRRKLSVFLAAGSIGAALFVAAPAAQAATTCKRHYNIDGFAIGTCVNWVLTPYQAQPQIWVDKIGNTQGCSIEIELWSEDGHGKVSDSYGSCTDRDPQYGFMYNLQYANRDFDTVHADAYLRTSHGGFRVGASGSIYLQQ